MQRNWSGILGVLVTIELGALILLVVAWLPDQIQSATPKAERSAKLSQTSKDDLVELKNEIAKIQFTLKELRKKGGSETESFALLKDIRVTLDDIGTQIYDVEQENIKNLMQVQKNILRRFQAISPGGATSIPKDPVKLDQWLKKGDVTLDREKKELRFPARFATPQRPLELVAASQGGMLHETLLEIKCVPHVVRGGLLSLGLQEGDPADSRKGIGPTGSELAIHLTWPGLAKPVPLQDMILDVRNDKAMSNAKWIFSGSSWQSSFLTGDDVYIPDESRVMISLTNNFGDLSVISCKHRDTHNEKIWLIRQDMLPKDPEAIVTVIVKGAP